MKNIFKSRLFLVGITALTFTGIGVLADTIAASNVTYNDTTLDQVLDDLYTISNPANLETYTNSAYSATRNTTNTVTLNLNKGHYICTSYYAASSTEQTASSGDTTSVSYEINGCSTTYTYNSHGHWNAATVAVTGSEHTSVMSRGANFYCEMENNNSTITVNYKPKSNNNMCSVSMQISCTKIR